MTDEEVKNILAIEKTLIAITKTLESVLVITESFDERITHLERFLGLRK